MLEHLVKSLIDIETTERENFAFIEAVELGADIASMNKDEDEKKEFEPFDNFSDVISGLQIPERASEIEREKYITAAIDKALHPDQHCDGKIIAMNEDDFKKINACLERCNECGEVNGADRQMIMKLVIALLKTLPNAPADKPCDSNVANTVDTAYQTLTEMKPSYNEALSAKDNMIFKLQEMAKYLK